jgi:hypothetical protein
MAKFPLWAVGKKGDATTFDQMVPNIVTKVATNSIVSNVTLANDSELTGIALGIGTWEIEAMVWATSALPRSSNLKTGWAFTGTLTGTPNRALVPGRHQHGSANRNHSDEYERRLQLHHSDLRLGSATGPAVAWRSVQLRGDVAGTL